MTTPVSPSITSQTEVVKSLNRLYYDVPDAVRGSATQSGRGLVSLGGLLRSGLISVAAELTGSGAELNVAKLMGQLPWNVNLRQLQLGSQAMARWNGDWRAPTSWSPQQRGRAITESAKLFERFSSGQLTEAGFKREMNALVQGIFGAVRAPSASSAKPAERVQAAPAPEVVAARQAAQATGRLGQAIRELNADPSTASRGNLMSRLRQADSQYRDAGHLWSSSVVGQYFDFRAQAEAALARLLPAQQGTKVVEALSKAIRAYDAAPNQAAQRGDLNDALARARSLEASQGPRWTRATRANFDAYERQAQSRLYPTLEKKAPPAHRSITSADNNGAASARTSAATKAAALPKKAGGVDPVFNVQALSPVQRGSLALLVESGALGSFVDGLSTAPAASQAEVSARLARHAEAAIPSFMREHGAAIGEYMAARGLRDPKAIMAALPKAIESALQESRDEFLVMRRIAEYLPESSEFRKSVDQLLDDGGLPPVKTPPTGDGGRCAPDPGPANPSDLVKFETSGAATVRFRAAGPDARLLETLMDPRSMNMDRIKAAAKAGNLDLSELDIFEALNCQSDLGRERIGEFLRQVLEVAGPEKIVQSFNFQSRFLSLQNSPGKLLSSIPPEVRKWLFPTLWVTAGFTVAGNNVLTGIQNIFLRTMNSLSGIRSPGGASLDKQIQSQPGLVASVSLEEAKQLLENPRELAPERVADFLNWIEADFGRGDSGLLAKPFSFSEGRRQLRKSEILDGRPTSATRKQVFEGIYERANALGQGKDSVWGQLVSRYLLSKMDATLGAVDSARAARPLTRAMLLDPQGLKLRTELLRRLETAALNAALEFNYPVAQLSAVLEHAHSYTTKVQFAGANPGFEDEMNVSSRIQNWEAPQNIARAMEMAEKVFKVELDQLRSTVDKTEPLVTSAGLSQSAFYSEWSSALGQALSLSTDVNSQSVYRDSLQLLKAHMTKLGAAHIERDGQIIPLAPYVKPVFDELEKAGRSVNPNERRNALETADRKLQNALERAQGASIYVPNPASSASNRAADAARTTMQQSTARAALTAQRESQAQARLRDALDRWDKNRESWNLSQSASARAPEDSAFTTDGFVFPLMNNSQEKSAAAYVDRAYSELVSAGALKKHWIDGTGGAIKTSVPSFKQTQALRDALEKYYDSRHQNSGLLPDRYPSADQARIWTLESQVLAAGSTGQPAAPSGDIAYAKYSANAPTEPSTPASGPSASPAASPGPTEALSRDVPREVNVLDERQRQFELARQAHLDERQRQSELARQAQMALLNELAARGTAD